MLAAAVWALVRERILAHLLPIVRGQAHFAEHLLVRNQLIVLEPFVASAMAFRSAGLSVSAVLMVAHHDFEQLHHGRKLARMKLVQQFASDSLQREYLFALSIKIDSPPLFICEISKMGRLGGSMPDQHISVRSLPALDTFEEVTDVFLG